MKSNKLYWIDDNHNKWKKIKYTEQEAILLSATMIKCHYCSDCSDCRYCHYCNDCRYCNGCRYCSYCRDCTGCSDCRYCHYCSGCRNWLTNPERIVSPKIGSRKDQTTCYFIGNKTQIVCGCFVGNLKEFKARIEKVHGNNEHAVAYKKWLKRVDDYRRKK